MADDRNLVAISNRRCILDTLSLTHFHRSQSNEDVVDTSRNTIRLFRIISICSHATINQSIIGGEFSIDLLR